MSATLFRAIAGSACGLALIGLIVSIVRGMNHGPITTAVADMAANPWGLATLIDVYIGLAMVAVWLWCVERRLGPRLIWIPLLFVLGNVVTLLVLLLRLRHSDSLSTWLLAARGKRDA
ncbi:MAG: DUF1475 family protein [Planctomycetota bacterium]|jgi:hypothetical protein|nr:DUF1475 family protein [Planctomycetota bacterium]